jgi:tRNA threonylcarbamoyladenosine biosynthesis protein TsaE
MQRGHTHFSDEQKLETFAIKMATVLTTPMTIWLEGDLGTGKTSFARHLIHALGYEGRVKSPTYGLMEQYPLTASQVLHLDLYRIADPEELEFLGLVDLIDHKTILLIEWPEKGGQWLPEPDFIFTFSYAGKGRDLNWLACSKSAQAIDIHEYQTPNCLH